jgi:hypothetical protein
VVYAAISELRYAGRKFVDACQLLSRQPVAADARRRALAFLSDATEDCVKAKHDAIDASVHHVVFWFNEVEKRLSLSRVVEFFPEYLDVTAKIYTVQERISISRGNRNADRDEIYDEIEREFYGTVLSLYGKMRRTHARVEAEIASEQAETLRKHRRQRTQDIATVISAVVGVAGFLAAFW